MNRQDQTSGLVWLAVGLFIVIGSVLSMDMGTLREPGAGLFPLITGGLVSLLSAIVLYKAFWGNRTERRSLRELWEGTGWRRVVYVIAALFLYTLLLKKIGFVLMTFLLMVFLLRSIEPQKWGLVAAYSIVAAVGSYVIFDRVLQVSLPELLRVFCESLLDGVRGKGGKHRAAPR